MSGWILNCLAISAEVLSPLNALLTCGLARITLDFDGSVISTKGWRSYYPLFCTIAKTGQDFDLLLTVSADQKIAQLYLP
jgi:hypothetical protein